MMGKKTAYREAKLRERAHELAEKEGVKFDEALLLVSDRREVTMKALKRSGKGGKVLAKRKVASTPFTRLAEKAYGSSRPLQGGSPGQGKRS